MGRLEDNAMEVELYKQLIRAMEDSDSQPHHYDDDIEILDFEFVEHYEPPTNSLGISLEGLLYD